MHSSSGLVSRNGFRQISAAGGALVPTFLPAIIMFLGLFCELFQIAAKKRDSMYTMYSPGPNCKIQQRCPPPSGYAPVGFRVLLLFVGNLTLQSNQ